MSFRFVPGLGAMEFIILFFPIIEIWEFKKRQRKAREEPGHTKFSKYSIAALELALRVDIDRLEEFAATKDFTGENIIFLKRVESWKEKWKLSEIKVRNGELPPLVLRSLYDTAEQIFNTLVHRESSDFPLNLEEDVYLPLDRVFGNSNPGFQKCSSVPKFPGGGKSIIAPFADDIVNARRMPGRGFREIQGSKGREYNDERPPTPPRKNSVIMPLKLPMGFGSTVFDKAEFAVKQMVLTNTWIRYVLSSLSPTRELEVCSYKRWSCSYVDSLPPSERSLIGVGPTISPPINWRWRKYFWKKDKF